MHRRVLVVVGWLSVSGVWGPNCLGEELSEARFRQLHQEFQRAPSDEPWRTIPWKIDLLDAQNLAVRQNKPIFIWAMDGHPLGCT